jgi:hydrogenase expression/formation protein HypC
LVPDANVGDYVVVHVGFALTKIDAEGARRTLALLAEAGAAAGAVP